MTGWYPRQYLKFADERTRAARDLLAQVPLAAPGTIYDLGCGPGNSTALLVERYPEAKVIGIDTSSAMLDAARGSLPAVSFVSGDLTHWMPDFQPDLLFSNATFQWVPDHLNVLARLSRSLKEGGALAVQMPDNLMEPNHVLMREVARQGLWAAKLGLADTARDPLPGPATYYARLKPQFRRLDIWHTIYNHPLAGARGILEWVKGTGLGPYLDPLDETERKGFLTAYEEKLQRAYPSLGDGTVLLRFPRLFLVGVR